MIEIILMMIITILGLVLGLVYSIKKYNSLKAEWEQQNRTIDILRSNEGKLKREVDHKMEQLAEYDTELLGVKEKHKGEIKKFKATIKDLESAVELLTLKEAKYLTDLADAEAREKALLDTITKLEKDKEAAAKKKTRATAKKKKEEKTEEQLEIAFEKLEEAIEIGEGETKCEKKRGRKKRDSK